MEEAAFSFAYAYLSDASFDGESRTISLDSQLFLPRSDSPLPPIGVVVGSMSADYFQYHRSLARQERSGGDPFADPVGLYSNVTGGVGVLGGYASTRRVDGAASPPRARAERGD